MSFANFAKTLLSLREPFFLNAKKRKEKNAKNTKLGV